MTDQNAAPEQTDNAGAGGTILGGDPPQSAASWRDTLPDDVRALPGLDKFDSPAALAKSYKDLEKHLGGKGLIPPPEGSPPEAFESFYKQIGRPETPDAYTPPEGAQFDEASLASFREAAHKAGLRADQAKALMAWQQQEIAKGQEAAQQAVVALRQEWGSAYDSKINAARLAVKHVDDDGSLQRAMNASGLGDSPALIKAFAKIGEMLGEPSALKGGASGFTMTPQAAKQQINQKYGDKQFLEAYNNAAHVGHDAAVEEMLRLQQIASNG